MIITGHSHGCNWTDSDIEKSIFDVMKTLGIDTMPSHSQMETVLGNASLSGAISKRGGSEFWASKFGLEVKACESKTGKDLEEFTCLKIENSLGIPCELMRPRYPYDIMAGRNIKIDVKAGFTAHNANGNYYTFNLEKASPTCDLFIAYCLNDDKTIKRTYVIPSAILSGKTQLSVGEITSPMYDKYLDAWQYVVTYNQFYQGLQK